MKKSYSEITPYIKELTALSNSNNNIKADIYTEHNVKRGLRDLDGNGVVTGLTEISHIKAKEKGENGEIIRPAYINVKESREYIDIENR